MVIGANAGGADREPVALGVVLLKLLLSTVVEPTSRRPNGWINFYPFGPFDQGSIVSSSDVHLVLRLCSRNIPSSLVLPSPLSLFSAFTSSSPPSLPLHISPLHLFIPQYCAYTCDCLFTPSICSSFEVSWRLRACTIVGYLPLGCSTAMDKYTPVLHFIRRFLMRFARANVNAGESIFGCREK